MKIIKSFNIGDIVYFKMRDASGANSYPVKSKILGYEAYYNDAIKNLYVRRYIVQIIKTSTTNNTKSIDKQEINDTDVYASLEGLLFNEKPTISNDMEYSLNIGDIIYIYDKCSIKEYKVTAINSFEYNHSYCQGISLSIECKDSNNNISFFKVNDKNNKNIYKSDAVYFNSKNEAINYVTNMCVMDYTKTK